MSEEAQKRNTDCVYFLASPLTCKKGNDCEYRHSEAARINPRDCWWWLSGTCLNANCPFRHPPLDGRPATTQGSTPLPTGSTTSAASISAAAPSAVSKSVALPTVASKPVAVPTIASKSIVATVSTISKPVQVPIVSSKSIAAPSAASKSRVPCFFFSQGYCAKGDRCPFLHGQPAAASIEAAVYKKPPKAPAVKVIETDKAMTLIKGNSSTVNKETPRGLPFTLERRSVSQTESQSVPSKATAPAREVPLLPNDGERARTPDSSVTSASARRRIAISDDKTRQIHVSGDRSRPMQNIVERSRQAHSGETRSQQPISGNQRHWQLQSSEDRLRQGSLGEERKQNGFQPEEWWKESASSGLDVLADRGPDRMIFPGDDADAQYHDNDSGKNRSGGRIMRSDDLTEFEYEVSGDYDQSGYYDSLGQRDHGPQEYQEQEVGPDHHGSFDRLVGQPGLPYNARPSEGALARDRRGIVVEQEMQHGSGDLRDHLSKRRRNDRVQHPTAESSSRKVYQDTINYHKRRHQDEHSKQEVLMLNQAPSQQGVRSNHRRPSGRVDSVGIKRAHHELGSDYGSVSPDRVPLRSSPSKRPVNDPSRLKLKDTDSGWYASDAASIPEAGGYTTSNSKKPEQKKDASNFAGPKSLAQIKAEKRRAEAENGFKAVEGFDGHKGMSGTDNFPDQWPLVVIKSQISSASDSDVDQVHKGMPSEDRKSSLSNELVMSPDFEEPKSLSLIMKVKQKPDADGDDGVEKTAEEIALKKTSSLPGIGADKSEVSLDELVSLDTSKVLEDGEVLPDTNNTTAFSSEVINGRKQKHVDSPDKDLSEMPVHESGLTSYIGKEGTADEVQRNQGENAKGETTFYDDMMEEGIEAGGNASDEEFSFDDDEEDDDFAKKLGGFFS